ncbi:unnamed protein product [Prorocentrum cordatum]|uniref:Uncharacterized protein n=1 Tax=Prorocentrum cordatum TaxID=2364126 RepID=A0ABN9RL14_9DINO|nr:unnamed protein product [Polarella glacialis]
MAAKSRWFLLAAALPIAASIAVEKRKNTDAILKKIEALVSADSADGSLMSAEVGAPPAKRTMVGTVLRHTQAAPVDIMLSHQIRMLSSSRKNVEQVAVINAKVPGVDNALGTAHDPVIASLKRSYGTTGSVEVLDLESNVTQQQQLMQAVFSIRQGSTATFATKFFKQNLTTPDMKRQMAYFTAMMQFIDLCIKAEHGVEICANMQGESFLHRQDKKGLLELASKLFDDDDEVIALQPPSYCEYTQAHHKPSWAKKDAWTNSSFTKCIANATKAKPEAGLANMLFLRERLMAALPLTVNADDLNEGFDHAFLAGLSRAGAIKGMQCGHSFVIRPAGEEAKCKGKKLPLKAQALAAGKQAGSDDSRLSGEYVSFNQRMVQGIEVLADRMERGMIPGPTGSVGDKCMEMCPSSERIKQGMAWRAAWHAPPLHLRCSRFLSITLSGPVLHFAGRW